MARALFRKTQSLFTKKVLLRIGGAVLVLLFSSALVYSHLFGPVDEYATVTEFIVEPGTTIPQLAQTLKAEGTVKSSWALRLVLLEAAQGRSVRAGGYK